MVNYDDIFDSQQPKETGAGTQFSSFDKESWAAQKQQDRDSAYSMIEQTAQRMKIVLRKMCMLDLLILESEAGRLRK